MIYGEKGLYPISIAIQSRMVSFWTKVADDEGKMKLHLHYTNLYSDQTNKIN